MIDTIPVALRICERCGELAWGDTCPCCARIDHDSTEFALYLRSTGAVSAVVVPAENETLALQLWRLEVNEKVRKMIDQESTVSPAPLAAWKSGREELRAMMLRAARRLKDSAYICAVIGMMAAIFYEFRGFIADCFTLWFGGK